MNNPQSGLSTQADNQALAIYGKELPHPTKMKVLMGKIIPACGLTLNTGSVGFPHKLNYSEHNPPCGKGDLRVVQTPPFSPPASRLLNIWCQRLRLIPFPEMRCSWKIFFTYSGKSLCCYISTQQTWETIMIHIEIDFNAMGSKEFTKSQTGNKVYVGTMA